MEVMVHAFNTLGRINTKALQVNASSTVYISGKYKYAS